MSRSTTRGMCVKIMWKPSCEKCVKTVLFSLTFHIISTMFHMYFTHFFHTSVKCGIVKYMWKPCENSVKWCQPFHMHFHAMFTWGFTWGFPWKLTVKTRRISHVISHANSRKISYAINSIIYTTIFTSVWEISCEIWVKTLFSHCFHNLHHFHTLVKGEY